MRLLSDQWGLCMSAAAFQLKKLTALMINALGFLISNHIWQDPQIKLSGMIAV